MKEEISKTDKKMESIAMRKSFVRKGFTLIERVSR